MNITRVQIHILRGDPTNKVKAYADILLDDEFIIKGLAVREDQEGYTFVTMPYRMVEGTRLDIAHPLKESCRQYIETRVLDEYEVVLNKITSAKGSASEPAGN